MQCGIAARTCSEQRTYSEASACPQSVCNAALRAILSRAISSYFNGFFAGKVRETHIGPDGNIQEMDIGWLESMDNKVRNIATGYVEKHTIKIKIRKLRHLLASAAARGYRCGYNKAENDIKARQQ